MSDLRTDQIQGKIIHDYDGLEEADNELPRWWLAIFFLTAAFSIGYWFYYHEFSMGPSQLEAYEAEAKALAARQPKQEDLDDDAIRAWAKDPALVEKGRQLFAANCVACHGEKGEGKIGPNLTDDRWLRGGAPTDIRTQIADGNLAKGMPNWRQMLGDEAVKQVTAFVLTMRNTKVEGKAPEGEVYAGD